MDIKNYHFEIGDDVITTKGEIGKIVDICKCEMCANRGFFEPIWIENSDKHQQYQKYIDIYDAKNDFSSFYRIGKYRFNDFNKAEVLRDMAIYEEELKQLRKQLELIEKIEELETKNKRELKKRT